MTQVTSDYTVRGYRSEDEAQVLELVRRSLGESDIHQRTPAIWRWKHLFSPFGPSHVWVACDDSGQLIGLRCFMQWELKSGEHRVRAARAVDTCTHPNFRRKGIFSTLTRSAVDAARAEGIHLVFNTPNNDVLPGYLKLGWRYVATVQPLIKVLHPPRFVRGLLSSRLGKQKSRANSPEEFFREQPTPVQTLFERGDALDRLIQLNDQSSYRYGSLRTHRSGAYLHWRYGEHPSIPYWTVFVEHDGELKGCVIFRTNTRYRMKEVVLCELILAEPNQELAHFLLARLKSALRADYLVGYFPEGSFPRRTLDRWGFRTVPRLGMNFAVSTLDPNLPQDPQLFNNWNLSLGDLELF